MSANQRFRASALKRPPLHFVAYHVPRCGNFQEKSGFGNHFIDDRLQRLDERDRKSLEGGGVLDNSTQGVDCGTEWTHDQLGRASEQHRKRIDDRDATALLRQEKSISR